MRVKASKTPDLAALADVPVPLSGGGQVVVRDVAALEMVAAPPSIRRFRGRRFISIFVRFTSDRREDVRGLAAALSQTVDRSSMTIDSPPLP